MSNKIKEYILQNIITKTFGLLWTLVGSLLIVLGPLCIRPILQPLSKGVALLLLGETIIIILILSAFILVLFKHKLKFGIYWDKNKNPYCPVCKTPLRVFGDNYGFELRCPKCNEYIPIKTDNDKSLTLVEAKKLL